MGSDMYLLGSSIVQLALAFVGIGFLVAGFHQRQEYEKRQRGTLSLTIGGGFLVLLATTLFMPDDRSSTGTPDATENVIQSQQSAADSEDVVVATRLVETSQLLRVTSRIGDDVKLAVTYFDEDASGTITLPSGDVRLVRAEGATYLNPSPGAWAALGQSPAEITAIDGRWARLQGDDNELERLGLFATREWLRDYVAPGSELERGGQRTVRGDECRMLTGATGHRVCLAEGPTRVVRAEAPGERHDLRYDGEAESSTVPDRVIDAASLAP